MASIRDIVWTVGPQRTRWRPSEPATPSGAPVRAQPKRRKRLTEIEDFGANPGALRMLVHVPTKLAPGAPLVVVLHGCSQNAEGYDAHSGWSALADEIGFALLYPEQRRSNNPAGCFNWFLAADSARGLGEARSIREMIETLAERRRLDRSRVFVTGLSAGGAMAAALLGDYPDVFAAGAVIAGLPCGAAAGVNEALAAMERPKPKTDEELGDAVRAGAPYDGPWPRVSIWHGLADQTVAAENAEQLVRQWLDVHGAADAEMREETADGRTKRVWSVDGRAVVEATTIAGMGHGTPLDGRFGERSGPFMLDVGISSTRAIAAFFGLERAETGDDEEPRDGTGASTEDVGPQEAPGLETPLEETAADDVVVATAAVDATPPIAPAADEPAEAALPFDEDAPQVATAEPDAEATVAGEDGRMDRSAAPASTPPAAAETGGSPARPRVDDAPTRRSFLRRLDLTGAISRALRAAGVSG